MKGEVERGRGVGRVRERVWGRIWGRVWGEGNWDDEGGGCWRRVSGVLRVRVKGMGW